MKVKGSMITSPLTATCRKLLWAGPEILPSFSLPANINTYPKTINSPYFTGAFDGWFSWSGENMSLASDFFSNFRSLIKSCGTLFSLFPVKIKKMKCKRVKSINYTNLHTYFWSSWYRRYIILHLLLSHVLALLEITLKRSHEDTSIQAVLPATITRADKCF